MDIFNTITGNASEIYVGEIMNDYQNLLARSEKIERAYKVVRDLLIFTDKRLIIIDVQGLTGKKTEYHSIPYKSITHFSIETAGNFELDSELKIWISGMGPEPLEKKFAADLDVFKLQSILTEHITK